MAGAVPWRVGYVIGGLDKGGAEYQLHELLRLLDRDRFAPAVFVLDAGGFWVEPIRRLGVPVVELPRRGHGDLGRLRRLRRALRAFAPHLLHTIRWAGNSYGRFAALGLGIPVVVASERARVLERPAWHVGVDRLLDRMTHAYLVNCEAIADGLVVRERVARSKIVVVPNGIDVSALPPFALDRRMARAAIGLDPGRRLVTQVGRLTAQKDYPTFLRAAALVGARRPDVDFLVVGEGGARAELEAFGGALGLTGRVRFTGLRHDVPALLRASDVLTLTSVFEGFPNVLLEAMANGAVAVATAVDGASELVAPEETGLLVPPRVPEAVAGAVLRVLGDPAFGERLAHAARRRVETDFTVEAMARRTAAAYTAWLAARAPVPAVVAAA